jgi:hypothetical protein
MIKADETKVLTLDNETYAVDALDAEVQRLVEVYDHWKQKELDSRLDMLMAQAAIRDITREILSTVQKKKQEAAEAAEKAAAANEETKAE